ncbi:hypothetical protein D3C73_1165340 [compost metagenome]
MDMLAAQFGGYFTMEATNVIGRLVDTYNRTESEDLLDSVIESFKIPLNDYSPVDAIIAHFLALVERPVDMRTYRPVLEYSVSNDTIVIRPHRRPAPNPTTRIKEDFNHAQAQGDFLPERLRRAYEELVSSGL